MTYDNDDDDARDVNIQDAMTAAAAAQMNGTSIIYTGAHSASINYT